jgi:hypothetical protein
MGSPLHERAWRQLDELGRVLTLKYSWGPAIANALAIQLDTGAFLVVSPPMHPAESVWKELATDGGVAALLAPNAFHYLGQAAWRARFPAATSFAPSGALPRLRKRAGDVPFEPTEALERQLPPSVRLMFPEGQKSPDTMIRIAAGHRETVWWLGDLFSNTTPGEQR